MVVTRAGHTETTIEAPVSSAGKIEDMTVMSCRGIGSLSLLWHGFNISKSLA